MPPTKRGPIILFAGEIDAGEIFVFWSLLKIIFRKISTPKYFLKIDHF